MTIEELIRELADASQGPKSLMREHLEAARFYLFGSMPHEYHFTLGLAKELLPDIEDRPLRAHLADFLHSQESDAAATQESTAS